MFRTAATPFPEGDSTVHLPSGDLHIRYKPSATAHAGTLVIFSGFRKKGSLDFSGASHAPIRNDIIWIYDEFGDVRHNTYYHYHQGTDTPHRIVLEFFCSLRDDFGVPFSEIVVAGFSKGASAAIEYGLSLGLSSCIAVAPQFRIGTYAVEHWPAVANFMFGDGYTPSQVTDADRLLPNILARHQASQTAIYVISSEQDQQWESEIRPNLDALNTLFNFNLIKTESALVTEHVDVTAFNVPLIQGLMLLSLDGITPRIDSSTNGRLSNRDPRVVTPPIAPHTPTAKWRSAKIDQGKFFPDLDMFFSEEPLSDHGVIDRTILIGDRSFRLGSVIYKRASWRNFHGRYVNYDAARTTSLRNSGIDIGAIPVGQHAVSVELLRRSDRSTAKLSPVADHHLWSADVICNSRKIVHFLASKHETTISIISTDSIQIASDFNTLKLLKLSDTSDKLFIRGRLARPGTMAENWGSLRYWLQLDDGQKCTFVSLGLLDRPAHDVPEILSKAYYADMRLDGIDLKGLPNKRLVLSVLMADSQGFISSGPLGVLDLTAAARISHL